MNFARWALPGLLGLTLTACSVLPPAPAPKAVYDFGPTPHPVTTTTPRSNTAPALRLAEVEAVAALDGSALLYRLAYTNAQQLQPYAQARWSMSPAQLLHQRLGQALARTRTVLSPQDAGPAAVLRVELEEFSQVFSQPDRSTGQVRLRATLINTRGQVLAQHSLGTSHPAPTADAAGGVHALAAASDEAVARVLDWVMTAEAAAR